MSLGKDSQSIVRFKMMAGLSANLFSAGCIIAIVELPDFETGSVFQTARRWSELVREISLKIYSPTSEKPLRINSYEFVNEQISLT
jgi:hypothetical protein